MKLEISLKSDYPSLNKLTNETVDEAVADEEEEDEVEVAEEELIL
jgi:hypothetical protein